MASFERVAKKGQYDPYCASTLLHSFVSPMYSIAVGTDVVYQIRVISKGSFINYVRMILAIFDPPSFPM